MRVIISQVAQSDLARIRDFNSEWGPGWAERVQTRLLDRCEALTTTPRIGRRTIRPDVRRLSVTDIQYVIDYRIERDAIRILRIFSTRELREPS